MSKLVMVLDLLASGIELPKKYKDHQLTGNLHDFRECHIEPDWLLMYQIFENELILSTTATGTLLETKMNQANEKKSLNKNYIPQLPYLHF